MCGHERQAAEQQRPLEPGHPGAQPDRPRDPSEQALDGGTGADGRGHAGQRRRGGAMRPGGLPECSGAHVRTPGAGSRRPGELAAVR